MMDWLVMRFYGKFGTVGIAMNPAGISLRPHKFCASVPLDKDNAYLGKIAIPGGLSFTGFDLSVSLGMHPPDDTCWAIESERKRLWRVPITIQMTALHVIEKHPDCFLGASGTYEELLEMDGILISSINTTVIANRFIGNTFHA